MGKPKAKVDEKNCLSCGGCISVCPEQAIVMQNKIAFVHVKKCISCGICVDTCPIHAISMEEYE
jgi:ferredoxin